MSADFFFWHKTTYDITFPAWGCILQQYRHPPPHFLLHIKLCHDLMPERLKCFQSCPLKGIIWWLYYCISIFEHPFKCNLLNKHFHVKKTLNMLCQVLKHKRLDSKSRSHVISANKQKLKFCQVLRQNKYIIKNININNKIKNINVPVSLIEALNGKNNYLTLFFQYKCLHILKTRLIYLRCQLTSNTKSEKLWTKKYHI